MSSMLKEAIVDAQALRESALKTAESVVIEKYSTEVRDTLEKILEQDDMLDLGGPADAAAPDLDLGATPAMPAQDEIGATDEMGANPDEVVENDEDIPLAATNDLNTQQGQNLDTFPDASQDVEVNIDLGALREALQAMKESDEESQEFEISPQIIEDLLSEDDEIEEGQSAGVTAAAQQDADVKAMDSLEGDDENSDDEDVDAAVMSNEDMEMDALVDALVEKLTVDIGAELSGWAGRPAYDVKWEMEKEMAHRRGTEAHEELEVLKKAQEELVFENNQLIERNKQCEAAVSELREGLQDVNLSNARLLYTNRVLRNTSLNERQKEKIVEAISKAGTVTEARTIFETLQSTVEAKPSRSPKSLSEAIGRNRSSVIRATRHESTSSDPFQERMKRLAGIK